MNSMMADNTQNLRIFFIKTKSKQAMYNVVTNTVAKGDELCVEIELPPDSFKK